mmetsp:Transcript_48598/g.105686  ORF Transcript_48598/g.105686 Transcript_48598/m.105686 type:complete len:99 (+) Transcript_48598:786-1082(+)
MWTALPRSIAGQAPLRACSYAMASEQIRIFNLVHEVPMDVLNPDIVCPRLMRVSTGNYFILSADLRAPFQKTLSMPSGTGFYARSALQMLALFFREEQ